MSVGFIPDHDQWLQELDRAIMSTDDHAIWEIMQTQMHNEDAHDHLAEKVSRMAFRNGERTVFCELFMIPVIAMHGSNLLQSENWGSVNQAINDALCKWFTRDNNVILFAGVTPYDWISTWTPKAWRGHLMRLLPKEARTERIVFHSEDIALPDNAPRLGFITVACSTHSRWPTIPSANSVKDARLKSVIKLALQVGDPAASLTQTPAVVWAPERVKFAVADGVCNWLQHLHEQVGIEGYTAMPAEGSSDVIKVTLKLTSEEVPFTQFLVRQHQIGSQGVQDILSVLHSIAPILDTPADMSELQVGNYRKQWS